MFWGWATLVIGPVALEGAGRMPKGAWGGWTRQGAGAGGGRWPGAGGEGLGTASAGRGGSGQREPEPHRDSSRRRQRSREEAAAAAMAATPGERQGEACGAHASIGGGVRLVPLGGFGGPFVWILGPFGLILGPVRVILGSRWVDLGFLLFGIWVLVGVDFGSW